VHDQPSALVTGVKAPPSRTRPPGRADSPTVEPDRESERDLASHDGAGARRRRLVLGLRRATVIVLVGALVATFVSAGLTHRVVSDAERRQLQTRVREASLVFQALIDNFVVPMQTAATVMRATGASAGAFETLARPAVGAGKSAVGAALLHVGAGASAAHPVVVSRVGEPLALDAGGRTRNLGVVNGQLTVVDLLSSPVGRRIGLLLGPPAMPADYAVYAEVQFPLPGVTLRNEAAFSDLDYVVYVGTAPRAASRILGTVPGPITKHAATTVVHVGNSQLLIVASARHHLSGSLAGTLPWLMLLLGVVGAIAGSLLIEAVGRGRDTAIGMNERLEQQVDERTSELQAANRELESFSYAVSHDLRAPLRAIDGFSLALVEEYGDRIDEQGHDYVRRVRSATQRMGELIDDLLLLSRVTRADMKRERVDLSAMTRSIATRLEEAEPERHVTIVVADRAIARGDERLLRIALENLLSNAWKFTSKTPDARIEFAVDRTGGTPVFSVHDNGVGFNEQYADKLFTPFQRLHAIDEFEGNGIGLATVARVIRRHGGEAWARSRGNGATFFFTTEKRRRPAREVPA
jgi:signal transduction histidine kinase